MEERRPAPLAEAEGIPLIEEEVRIEKREVATGRVRVRTTTDTIEEIARATLNEDAVEFASASASGERLMQRPLCAPRTAS